MNYRIGTCYLGSDKLCVSVANQEIIPPPPSHWTMPYKLYKFSLMNYDDCTLVINDQTEIFLKANQGFCMDITDTPIQSVKIKEDGIEYNWIGAY